MNAARRRSRSLRAATCPSTPLPRSAHASGGARRRKPTSSKIPAIVTWRAGSSLPKDLAVLDEIALSCLDPEDWKSRRWLRLAPRYLGRMAHGLRLLETHREFAARFNERLNQCADRGEITFAFEIFSYLRGTHRRIPIRPHQIPDQRALLFPIPWSSASAASPILRQTPQCPYPVFAETGKISSTSSPCFSAARLRVRSFPLSRSAFVATTRKFAARACAATRTIAGRSAVQAHSHPPGRCKAPESRASQDMAR